MEIASRFSKTKKNKDLCANWWLFGSTSRLFTLKTFRLLSCFAFKNCLKTKHYFHESLKAIDKFYFENIACADLLVKIINMGHIQNIKKCSMNFALKIWIEVQCQGFPFKIRIDLYTKCAIFIIPQESKYAKPHWLWLWFYSCLFTLWCDCGTMSCVSNAIIWECEFPRIAAYATWMLNYAY